MTYIPHFKVKFLTPNRVNEVKWVLDIAWRCYRNAVISSGVGVSKQKRTIDIEMEPFTEGATEPLALPVEETEDEELIPGKTEKLVKIRSEYVAGTIPDESGGVVTGACRHLCLAAQRYTRHR